MKKITIIGGIAVDIEGVPYEHLIYKDSNPGQIHIAFGGVGRNIAENLVRLGLECNMVSAVGKDVFGQSILNHLKEIGLSSEYIDVLDSFNTAVYLSILQHDRDMELAINGMDIFSHWTGNEAMYSSKDIADSSLMILDTNLTTKLIEEIVWRFQDKVFLLDPVSVSKAKKVKDIIGQFHIIKPNKLEAEELTGLKIKNEEDLRRAGDYFCEKGVEKVFITCGDEGVYYRDSNQEGFIKVVPVLPLSTTGSGDAFTAGLAYGFLHGHDTRTLAKLGCACSYFALTSEKTVNDNLSEEKIKKYIEVNFDGE
ncbi:MAG: carbohydrate kinase family protein [Peptostreptococcales bacterium]